MGQIRQAADHQKDRRVLHRFLTALLVVGVILIVVPFTAYADPAEPDNLQIRDAKVFRHLIEDNDFFCVVAIDIGYNTAPDEPADTYFISRFFNSSGDDIGQCTPFSYGLSGYQYGIISFYFSASDAPTWAGTHTIKLVGNPTQWGTLPTPSNWALSSTDYSTGSDQAGNRSELAIWLTNELGNIEQDWDVIGELITATASSIVLQSAGQYYILGSIPGLNYMLPDIFIMVPVDIVYPDDIDWDDRGEAAETALEDTPIETLKNTLGEILGGIDPIVATTILVILGAIGLMIASYAKWQQTDPAYAVIPALLLYSAKMTFLPWAIFGIMVFVAGAYVAWMKLGKTG